MVAKSTIQIQDGAEEMKLTTAFILLICVAHVVVEALLEIKAMTAQMKVITKAVMKVAKNKMIL